MENNNEKRLWLPSFSELIDRLSIHQLKEVFIADKKHKYRKEMAMIVHDLDVLIKNNKFELNGEMVRAIVVLSQINTHIWYNENKARSGQDQDLSLLKLTHGLNGIRMRAMNHILELIGELERQESKTDCLASEHSNWDVVMSLADEIQ